MEREILNHFSNIFIAYYYGSYIHLNQSWKGYNQNCVYSKFYYITEGECEIKVGDTAYHGIPGRLFYIPAGTRHSFYHINENYLTKHWIHFKLETGGESIDKRYQLPLFVDVTQDTALVECFQAINLPSETPSEELNRKAKLLQLFSIFLCYCEDGGKMNKSGNNNDFNKVLEFIKENLDRKPTTNQLADLMHVHPNYFIRMFKSKTGMAPGKYMNNLRCETAKSLLENSTTPINNIMLQVGFDESSAFSHFFRVNTGYSPHEFRLLFGKYK